MLVSCKHIALIWLPIIYTFLFIATKVLVLTLTEAVGGTTLVIKKTTPKVCFLGEQIHGE